MTTMAAHEAVLLFAGPECWADEARELSPGRPMNFTNVRRLDAARPARATGHGGDAVSLLSRVAARSGTINHEEPPLWQ
jgi:hypothetical protein